MTEALTSQQSSGSDVADPHLNFTELPYELRLKVFSFLTKEELITAALVSKDFRSVAYDPSLWRSATVNSKAEPVDVLPLLRRSHMLQHLTLRASAVFTFVSEHAKWFPQLKSLDVGFSSDVSSETIARFVKNCPCLTYLNVEGCRDVDEATVMQICRWKYLDTLILSHCCLLTDNAIEAISRQCQSLQHFNADGITRITDRSICTFATNLCETLVWLELDGEELTDASFYAIKHCSKLKTLFISYAENLTDASLSCIQELSELTRLKLRRGPNLTADGIRQMFLGTNLRNLIYLEFDSLSIDDDGVHALVKCCTKLQCLALPWCWDITELGLSMIVVACRNLTNLVLLGLFRIHGYCLPDVPLNLPKLRYMHFGQCNEIVDSLLQDLVQIMPQLEVYNYYGELVVPSSDDDLDPA
ncbi:F-box/LRR-repeat protein 7-like [Ornithodoros turicata]|uniref:F-box/LRR-repeat protein 7-like n=1 Tax=Ornithodoros turicata TaxID=34597 RepID=UPI0031396D1D